MALASRGAFDRTNCFRLNGAALNLKGGCVHHGNGALGSKKMTPWGHGTEMYGDTA